jgi:hypothetical protein
MALRLSHFRTQNGTVPSVVEPACDGRRHRPSFHCGRELGFEMEAIRKLLTLQADPDGSCAHPMAIRTLMSPALAFTQMPSTTG